MCWIGWAGWDGWVVRWLSERLVVWRMLLAPTPMGTRMLPPVSMLMEVHVAYFTLAHSTSADSVHRMYGSSVTSGE